jgi:O-antigen/teichoic acid export membrane protein
MSLRRGVGHLAPTWGTEGQGLAWLGIGIGATFILGLALQLIGLRTLDPGSYATLVLCLSIGNVASALAGAIQPVVAVRSATDDPAFLPASLVVVALAFVLAVGIGATLLAPHIGWTVALLACLQIPLHCLLGVGLGRLQARRAFSGIAVSLVLLSVVRIVVVLPAAWGGQASATSFALALPLALLAAIAVAVAWGAYRTASSLAPADRLWAPAGDGSRLLGQFALWAAAAWLINGDAVYARLRLPAEAAGAYALAFTLGRQPIYAVAPLTMVLLPVTIAAHPSEQRARLRAILAVSIILLAGTLLVLGPWPVAVVRLLTGDASAADPTMIRGYAVVGSGAAAATLLLTFAFALGKAPRLAALLALVGAGGLLALTVATTAHMLLGVQAIVVLCLVLISLAAAIACLPERQARTPLTC